MIVNLITRPEHKIVGLSRYDRSIYPYISKKATVNIFSVKPLPIPQGIVKLFNLAGLDPLTATTNYPFYLKPKPREGIWHFTSQTLALILNFTRPSESIVTVHDIIPFITRHDKEISLFNRFEKFLDYLSMQGLKKAKRIITDSEYSKKTLIKYRDYPGERIDVIYLGIDHDKFKVIKNSRKKLEKYGIENECTSVLYVGSEMPRKNLQTLIKAFYKLKKKISNARLIKVGEHQAPEARERLKILITELGLQNDVVFTGYVSEEDLPLFYNAADLFVQPSLYEGFGLPILEAMACGTPVVSSNATSLPEVVWDAGIMVDPKDADGFVKAMYEVLTNDGLRENIIKKGLERAKMFTWKKTAEETLKVYEKMEEVE